MPFDLEQSVASTIASNAELTMVNFVARHVIGKLALSHGWVSDVGQPTGFVWYHADVFKSPELRAPNSKPQRNRCGFEDSRI